MRFDTDTMSLYLSVGELCRLSLPGGDLDGRFPLGNEEKSRRTEWHQKLQKEAGIGYETEVFLSHTATLEGMTVTVAGCADGVFTQNGRTVVEEIKNRRGHGAEGEREWARLAVYAYFLSAARNLPHILLRLRVVSRNGGGERCYDREMSREELKARFDSLLAAILPFAQFEMRRRTVWIPELREIPFPYPTLREGQVELIETAFRTFRRGGRLFAQAPTGIGKTISTLYPAVKALGAGHCDRIFYLTAKQSTRREAYAAAGRIFAAGGKLHTVMLYSKEQMCLRPGGCKAGAKSCCNPADCPFAAGYYDRSQAAVLHLLSAQNGFPRQTLIEAGKTFSICPYELSLDFSRYCEIIICDYNYAFDPAVFLRRYFQNTEGEKERFLFLVDEAHNLPDRARDMYTAVLPFRDFEAVYARIDPLAEPELEAALGGFVLYGRRLCRLCTEGHVKHEDGTESGYHLNREAPQGLQKAAMDLRRELDRFLKKGEAHPLASKIGELSAILARLGLIGDYYDEHFLTYFCLVHDELTVKLCCLDPSGVLGPCISRAYASVFFSATLTPPSYFADILGGGKGAVSLSLPSPYDPSRLCVTVLGNIETRMEARATSYRKVVSAIAAMLSARAGNYMVYFPSFAYLKEVYERFCTKYPQVSCICQEREMNTEGKNAFLSFFKEDKGVLRVGFCVLGGSFSEGVDLPGDRLIGAAIVGVGLPGLSDERNFLRDYYEHKCEEGYHYAYTYPGMNRVLQAAGRVIRREEDRGVIVLIDSRYAEEPYLHLYPPHWRNMAIAGNSAALLRRLQHFWGEKKQK